MEQVLVALQRLASISEQQPALMAAALATVLSSQPPREVVVREIEPQKVSNGQSVDTSGQLETLYTREKIVEAGRTYTRDTHPLLFAVVDWLETNSEQREAGVRPIAAAFEQATGTSVSKSWAAVAKNYWKSKSA